AVSFSAGITGAPAGCEFQPQTSLDGVSFFNYGNPISIAPAVSASAWLPPNGHPGPLGQKFKYVYTCDTYPSAGTFSLSAFYSGRDSTQATTNDTAIVETASNGNPATITLALNGARGASISLNVLSGSGSAITITPQIIDVVTGSATTVPVYDLTGQT